MSSLQCRYCGRPISPDMAFCSHCGAALVDRADAASGDAAVTCPRCGAVNASNARYCHHCAQPLVPGTVDTDTASVMRGARYAHATQEQIAAAFLRKAGRPRTWLITGAAAIVPVIALAIAALLLTPRPPKPCRLGCTTSPYPIQRSLARPLIAHNRYVSTAFGYTVDYLDRSLTPQTDATSVAWGPDDPSVTGYIIRFEGVPANGRSAQDIVEAVHQSKFPDFPLVNPIPGAEIGYWPGYGAVYDNTVPPANGQSVDTRVIIMAAVKKGLAIEMIVDGPFDYDSGDGHPLPAQIDQFVAQFSDKTLNTVAWKGDVPL